MWSNLLLTNTFNYMCHTDFRQIKIYNAVLCPFYVRLIINTAITGLSGFGTLLGTVVGLGILLIPYLLGGMGAGDVKLLAVIGAIKGMSFVILAAFNMAFAGGIMALLIILFHKSIEEKTVSSCFLSSWSLLRNSVPTLLMIMKH